MPRLIPLTKGAFAIVNANDFKRLSRLSRHSWSLDSGGYAIRHSSSDALMYGIEKTTRIEMGRDVLRKKSCEIVDHKNRNRLDNRRRNLRLASRPQNGANSGINSRNTSGYRGVSFNKISGKFSTQAGGKHFGKHATAEEAAKAYNIAAKKLWGAFAFQNKTNKTKGKTYGSK